MKKIFDDYGWVLVVLAGILLIIVGGANGYENARATCNAHNMDIVTLGQSYQCVPKEEK